jgi:predicted enzyme related to lactoylglutathione lyase
MNEVRVGQKTYEMPPHEGITISHFLTVADAERSAQFYKRVFGGTIVRTGEPTGYIIEVGQSTVEAWTKPLG